jgi:branched-chain amino acid aminotransferase
MKQNIDWKNLGFNYCDTGTYVTASFINGQWGPIEVNHEPHVNIHIAATCLHYGQACFEGMKAFTRTDGSIAIFRKADGGHREALGDGTTTSRFVCQRSCQSGRPQS